MLRTLLSKSQREELFHVPHDVSEQTLVSRYTFSSSDLELITKQREEQNRIGFAVQLAHLRFPGRPLQEGEQVSSALLNYIAVQLQISPLAFGLYARRDATRRQHVRKVQVYLGLHQLSLQDEQALQSLLLPT